MNWVPKYPKEVDLKHIKADIIILKIHLKYRLRVCAAVIYIYIYIYISRQQTRQAKYVSRTSEARSCNHCCCGQAVLHILNACL